MFLVLWRMLASFIFTFAAAGFDLLWHKLGVKWKIADVPVKTDIVNIKFIAVNVVFMFLELHLYSIKPNTAVLWFFNKSAE